MYPSVTVHDEIWASVPDDRELDDSQREVVLAALETEQRKQVRPRVLDLGCGDGRFTALLASTGAQVSGVDPSRTALERAHAAYPYLDLHTPLADGRVPFDDSAFELVVCIDVLQHVADTQLLLSEARRVLAPGAHLVVSVPWHGRIKNALIALRGFERHHDPLEPVLRHYTARSLRSLLAQLGFNEIVTAAAGGPPLLRRHLFARARRG
jgi:2-polyprenyl-3-methyl-5-hydroxy-6-metoxy-1,4-benzoquinol methylase